VRIIPEQSWQGSLWREVFGTPGGYSRSCRLHFLLESIGMPSTFLPFHRGDPAPCFRGAAHLRIGGRKRTVALAGAFCLPIQNFLPLAHAQYGYNARHPRQTNQRSGAFLSRRIISISY